MFGVSRGDGGEAVARSDEPSKLPILQRGGRSTHDTNAVVREDTPGVTTIALARLPDGGGKLFGCNCTRTLSRLHGYARYSGDEHVVVVVAFETERALCKSAAHGPEAVPEAPAFIFQPTLSQMWPEHEAGPPFAFKISMLHVFCSSHGLTHFAALFIDPRAK